jgi:ferredoxin-NADP reductase/predicted pyridoxine 5'-phosphate oxidase superfamily flavin-nucleotide-binding protein
MASAFAHLAFTPNVRTQQSLMGSRDAYSQLDAGEPESPALGPGERAFLEARDSFYLGTVGETGWPYVQHRGGPVGFLKVLDEQTIGYADFTGNRQYISVGNLAGDDRVSLFLMDYPNQVRLKIFGRARIIEESDDQELLAKLDNPHYRARVERGVVIRIEGFDWNCPKYITPRFTESEAALRIAEATTAMTQPPATVSASLPTPGVAETLGTGELALTVTGIRQMTPRIRAYELRSEDWSDLPPLEAGAHLEVPVRLGDGTVATRQYSLATHPDRRDMYEIAVLREDDGRGGSRTIHETWQIGTRLRVSPPINHFPLHADTRPAVLIAGGIGITPIKAMAQALMARGTPFELHYTGRTPVEMAYRDRLAVEFPSGYHTYFSRLPEQPHLDIEAILQQIEASTVVYVCGPVALIEAVLTSANRLGIDAGRIQYESFY